MAGAATPPPPPPACENLGVPLPMVRMTELPANADAEVEPTCASQRTASYLGVRTGPWAPTPRHRGDRPAEQDRGLL